MATYSKSDMNACIGAMKFFCAKMLAYYGVAVNVTIEVLPLKSLKCGAAYQRMIQRPTMRRMMAKRRHPMGVMMLLVNRRAGGDLWLVDGNHRRSMLEADGEKQWPCAVMGGLTYIQEAEMWPLLNADRATAHSLELLNAQIQAQDKDALSLASAVHESGFRFPFEDAGTNLEVGVDPVCISCVQAIRKAHSIGLLGRTLDVIRVAWPNNNNSVRSAIIRGVCTFLRSPVAIDSLNHGKLVSALVSFKGPLELLSDAKQEDKGTEIARAIALHIAERYNKGLNRELKVLHVYKPGRSDDDIAE